MGDLTTEKPVLNNCPESKLSQANITPRRLYRGLKLSQLTPTTPTMHPSGTLTSPTSARRRAALTPSQTWLHASGTFLAPEPHIHEDWIYRSTDTIPETGSSGLPPASNSKNPQSGLVSVATPAFTPAPPAHTTSSSSPRQRSYSSAGVYYSSAHRREPSSPSFRSSVTLSDHTYFDRPPSPVSTSSRWSEPLLNVNLSLSEVLASTTITPLRAHPSLLDEAEDPVRRAEQREERRRAMKERHAALRELRDRNKWAKAQARC